MAKNSRTKKRKPIKAKAKRKIKAREASEARAEAREVGRPVDYRPAFCEDARKLCLLGATDKELADFFGISEATLNNWKVDHPGFLESLKSGKDQADATVAEKLFRRAIGYEHAAVKIFADAKTGLDHVVDYTEKYPPDTAAAIFWLKNRQPAKWRDKQDLEHTGLNRGPIQTQNEITIKPDEAYLRLIGKK